MQNNRRGANTDARKAKVTFGSEADERKYNSIRRLDREALRIQRETGCGIGESYREAVRNLDASKI